MKISIITVVFNGADTLEDTIRSVQQQTHKDVEHILIDGVSQDHTMEIVNRFRDHFKQIVSEPDNGIYDAMNKGILLATGDVIGILNADDVYEDATVLSQVEQAHEDDNLDACYANLVYVKANDSSKIIRNWVSQNHVAGLSFRGWMPAHPTLFLKKRIYNKAGCFNTDLKYQADLEFCTRLFEVHKINSVYIPKLWVRMRLGGATNRNLKNIMLGNWESFKALQKLGLKRNALSYFFIKFSSRVKQYF